MACAVGLARMARGLRTEESPDGQAVPLRSLRQRLQAKEERARGLKPGPRFKTERCRHNANGKSCPFGEACCFAHSVDEVPVCLQFQEGACPLGKSCAQRHELPLVAFQQERRLMEERALADITLGRMLGFDRWSTAPRLAVFTRLAVPQP